MSLLFFFFFLQSFKGEHSDWSPDSARASAGGSLPTGVCPQQSEGNTTVCVWHTSARPRGSSAVEDGPVPVRSEGERGAFGVGLPPVRTQRGDGLLGKQRHETRVIVRRRLRTKRVFWFIDGFASLQIWQHMKPASSRKRSSPS